MQTGKDVGVRYSPEKRNSQDICLYTDVLQDWAHRKPMVESLGARGAHGDGQTPSKGLRTICFQSFSDYLGHLLMTLEVC